MKTITKKKQLVNKKQQEFYNFVDDKVIPFFEVRKMKFDTINPTILQDEWKGNDILITIPYGERMEPWLIRCINECYNDKNKTITVIMGAKINTNAWFKYVFPFASEICFVRRGKRPTAIVTYNSKCESKAFYSDYENTIAYTSANIPTGINKQIICNLIENDSVEEE